MRLDRSFVKLPFLVDADRLAEEVATIPDGAWRDHPEGAPGNDALVLVGVGGDPAGDSTVGPMAPTRHLENLPYTRRVLAALGSTIGRTRLMRIATETDLGTHVDTNYYWWHHVRVHVPVLTTPDVRFTAGDDAVHMGPGDIWVFDTWRPHSVENPAQSARIHLVVDTVGSAFLWDLITRPERAPIVVSAEGAESFPVEHDNWPFVMAPDEVERTLETLFGELARDQSPAAARALATLSPFRHEWRNLSARFGDDPAGLELRRALAEETQGRIDRELTGVRLPNGVELRVALAQLVLRPALRPSPRSHARDGAALRNPQPVYAETVPDKRVSGANRHALLAGPPRIVEPVFIVCPPRSGSSLLFETLQRSPDLATIGGESHQVIEGIDALGPAAHGWSSNRLDASDATEGIVAHLKDRFAMRMRDRDGVRSTGSARLLEKTPKNALRVPFLAAAFPDARFVYLYRDPRETVSSMLDAWRSGRFVTYPDLLGWRGQPWSMLLIPGWQDLDGLQLAEVVSRQWTATVELLINDLEALDPGRWCVASYDRLVSDPREEISRLCDFLGIGWDDELAGPLPQSQHTLDSPHPDKWLRNADELEPFAASITDAAARARALFAAPPRVAPVATALADRSDTAPARHDRPPEELFGSTHTASVRNLLRSLDSSLLVTTYQAGRVVFVRETEAGLNSHFRALASPMGAAFDGQRLAIGTQGEVMVFQNHAELAERLDPPDLHDACFVVRQRHATGDIRVHDLAWGGDELWLVNTRFSCLATLDGRHSFVPRWRPPFISALAPEDRCHLNGLCVIDGEPRFVTALGTSDTANGWRERKADGGVVIDVASGDLVALGLSMPHSPRWHDGHLWVLESGRGALCVIEPEHGQVERVASVPGFARGLTFAGRYAFIGLSRVREHTFDGLPLTRGRTERLRCGVWVVDTETGDWVGHLEFDGAVQEIFEVTLLPGLRYPELVEPGAPLGEGAFVLPGDAVRNVLL
jgi:uncharacterized protein (TIGR03032 family)